MKTIPEAIAERRSQIAVLEEEVAKLEAVAHLVGELASPSRVKPPPIARKAKPVRAETKKPGRPSSNGATFGCGHPRTDENSDIGTYVKADGTKSRNCRTCRIATQKRARDRKAGKTADEPDPVEAIEEIKAETPPGCCLACDEPLPPREPGATGRNRVTHDDPECKALYHSLKKGDWREANKDEPRAPSPPPAAAVDLVIHCTKCGKRTNAANAICSKCDPTKAIAQRSRRERDELERKAARQRIIDDFKAVTVVAKPPPATHAAAASRWQRQCTILDSETGKRCSLMTPHQLPHSASGRTFTHGFNPADLGGTSRPTREIDQQAKRGAGE